jgi:hypothetical protein
MPNNKSELTPSSRGINARCADRFKPFICMRIGKKTPPSVQNNMHDGLFTLLHINYMVRVFLFRRACYSSLVVGMDAMCLIRNSPGAPFFEKGTSVLNCSRMDGTRRRWWQACLTVPLGTLLPFYGHTAYEVRVVRFVPPCPLQRFGNTRYQIEVAALPQGKVVSAKLLWNAASVARKMTIALERICETEVCALARVHVYV